MDVYDREALALPVAAVTRASRACWLHGRNMLKATIRSRRRMTRPPFVSDQVGHPTFTADPPATGVLDNGCRQEVGEPLLRDVREPLKEMLAQLARGGWSGGRIFIMTRLGAIGLFIVLVALHRGGVAAAPAPTSSGTSVTTTVLPDPFPNLPPVPAIRSMVVEAGDSARSPSVLLGVYDVEMNPLMVVGVTQPVHGRVQQEQDGTFTYTPASGFVGEDAFTYVIDDGRGGQSTGRMTVRVVPADLPEVITRFSGLVPVDVAGVPLQYGKATAVPRLADLDGDGLIDLVVAAQGGVWWHRNIGNSSTPAFAASVPLTANGEEIRIGAGRVGVALADVDGDGRRDLVMAGLKDRTMHWYRRGPEAAGPSGFEAARPLLDADGVPFRTPDIRFDFGDVDGDKVPDVVIGTHAGDLLFARGKRDADGSLRLGPAGKDLDGNGYRISGSYNLNLRIIDLDGDGLNDLVATDNWGSIRLRLNRGVAGRPRFAEPIAASVTGPDDARVDLHALCDGMILDLADLDGDDRADLVVGGETGGRVHLARGRTPWDDLEVLEGLLREHPHDLGRYLAAEAQTAEKKRLQSALVALHGYLVDAAGPRSRQAMLDRLLTIIAETPGLLRRQTLEPADHPGMPSLAVQCWLTVLSAAEHDPAIRLRLAEAGGFTGAYRRLLLEHGLIYADNERSPRGAEAIRQWITTVSREVYPGTCITADEWLGGRTFLLRGHMKNTFSGTPESRGEYAFGEDARRIIGRRGSGNQFMTVVHHEASHDLDAYVRRDPVWTRRWGRMLVAAGGPDMRADPETSWFSLAATQEHFRRENLWNGELGDWDAAWRAYWKSPRGADWRAFGFMRGNINWFYTAPQETLATQGNQHFNSTEGRLQVAAERFANGFKGNLTEVLFFIDVWSAGLDKVIFYENDNASNQVLRFVRLRRTPLGHINRLDLGDRRYEFAVDEEGVVTEILHLPPPPAAEGTGISE